VDHVYGVTYDGRNVWFAAGDTLNAFDPASGQTVRSIDVAAHAGTAFDGQYLFQLAEDRIQKIDPESGQVLATIPAPGGGADSGLAWAEGTLWVGQYRDRKIHQVDPETGAILRTIESSRFVTGVTWVDGELRAEQVLQHEHYDKKHRGGRASPRSLGEPGQRAIVTLYSAEGYRTMATRATAFELRVSRDAFPIHAATSSALYIGSERTRRFRHHLTVLMLGGNVGLD
jgi:outer membrane protein assembly factor BamB